MPKRKYIWCGKCYKLAWVENGQIVHDPRDPWCDHETPTKKELSGALPNKHH